MEALIVFCKEMKKHPDILDKIVHKGSGDTDLLRMESIYKDCHFKFRYIPSSKTLYCCCMPIAPEGYGFTTIEVNDFGSFYSTRIALDNKNKQIIHKSVFESEEEYFQYCTVNDPGITIEEYHELNSLISNVKVLITP